MEKVKSADGATVSYERYGSGPPLLLVHGSFSDHLTNWQEVKDLLGKHFTVYAMARRGRGESSVTSGHTLEDEMEDTIALLRAIGEPASVLGHSYGAVCALGAAVRVPETIAKLALYEHPKPGLFTPEIVDPLEEFAARNDWDGLVEKFMRILEVPQDEIDEIKTTPFWNVWIADAPATLNDLRALVNLRFNPSDYRSLTMPVGLIIGSESPRENYVTDLLDEVVPDSRVIVLEGTAHEGMTMVPDEFVKAVNEFLLGESSADGERISESVVAA
jgi:pimeloyl-ACP methyl ester carboxylesterase